MALINGAVSATVAEMGGLQRLPAVVGCFAWRPKLEVWGGPATPRFYTLSRWVRGAVTCGRAVRVWRGLDQRKMSCVPVWCVRMGQASYWGGERGGAVGGRGGRKNQCRPAGSGWGHLGGTEGTGRSDRRYTVSHVPHDRPRVSLYDDKAVESPPSPDLQSLAVAPPALPRPLSFLLL